MGLIIQIIVLSIDAIIKEKAVIINNLVFVYLGKEFRYSVYSSLVLIYYLLFI